jgi:hypothetical protein
MNTFALSILILFLGLNVDTAGHTKIDVTGAWERESEGNKITLICSGRYFAATVYNVQEQKFVHTWGGSWRIEANKFMEVHEFNTGNPEYIGNEMISDIEIKKGKLVFKAKGKKEEEWNRIDNGSPGKLGGAWLITGRFNNEQVQKITPGARRTMKILSGTRFQWIAYNTDTKEFFGTGGGTYTTVNTKYTENIEFFSRDGSRVGTSLQFDFDLEDGHWRHKGLSSKGDPIDEVWTKREDLGM